MPVNRIFTGAQEVLTTLEPTIQKHPDFVKYKSTTASWCLTGLSFFEFLGWMILAMSSESRFRVNSTMPSAL
jgi:hypothetical protein